MRVANDNYPNERRATFSQLKGNMARIKRPDALRKKGVGYIIEQRSNQVKLEFYPTVFSKPPYTTESKIALIEDVEVLKTPLQQLKDRKFDEPWRFDIKQKAAHLKIENRGGQLSNSRTNLLPHQIFTAYKVVSNSIRRFLLADEVGLGKTIEAGLIFYALRQRGEAERTLIITPAGLARQWQEEMEDKFGVTFLVLNEDFLDKNPRIWDMHDLVIASIDTLKRENHKRSLLECQRWQLIIFDEAHKLSAKAFGAKVERTQNYRLALDLRDHTDSLLLLTATPHQGDESEFRNLLGLLSPNIVFSTDQTKLPPSAVSFKDVIIRNRKHDVSDDQGGQVFKGKDTFPRKVEMSNEEKVFHSALLHYLEEGYGLAEQDPLNPINRAIGFVMTTFQKLAASSTEAIMSALIKRRDNLQQAIQPLAELMEYDARFEGEYEARKSELEASSPFIKDEINLLDNLINDARAVAHDAKAGELLKIIESAKGEKILIFTEYIATQEYILKRLEAKFGHGTTTYIRGQGMDFSARKMNIAVFRDNPQVRFLVSTEAGREGINLQFCHIIVNYDIPWNPMRLEQRVGRVYRYLQDKRVVVYNLQNAGTIEDKVRSYLEEKMDRAARTLSQVTGEDSEEIKSGLLGQIDETLDVSYDELYKKALRKGGLEWSKEQIDRGIEKAKNAWSLAYNSLFKYDISRFNPKSYQSEVRSLFNLEDLQEFVERFIRNNRREIRKDENGHLEFLTPEILKGFELKERYTKVTFSREEATRSTDPELEFVAFGHPLFEAILETCGSYDFGGNAVMRTVLSKKFKGLRGIQFNFIVRRIQMTPRGEETTFQIFPIFIDTNYSYSASASLEAIVEYSYLKPPEDSFEFVNAIEADKCYLIAREQLQKLYGEQMPWEENLSLLNVAWLSFV
jgi:superfamily II DNA or RNA helicase